MFFVYPSVSDAELGWRLYVFLEPNLWIQIERKHNTVLHSFESITFTISNQVLRALEHFENMN